MSVAKDFISALRATQKKTKPADDDAVVRRIEGNTAWVHIPGGVDETPVQMTINCEIGETVKVRRADGRAWIVGNGTAPPTDDKRAIRAEIKAIEASRTASDYITDTQNGVFVHPADDATSGWRIADAIELLRNGVSYIWAGLRESIPTILIGRHDGAHIELDEDSLVLKNSDQVPMFECASSDSVVRTSIEKRISKFLNWNEQSSCVIDYVPVTGEEIRIEYVIPPDTTWRYATFTAGTSNSVTISNLTFTYDGVKTFTFETAETYASIGRLWYPVDIIEPVLRYGTTSPDDERNGLSATFGNGLLAKRRLQFVIGEYNRPENDKFFIIGNGDDDNSRLNIFTVDGNGVVNAFGGYTVGGNPLIETVTKTESTGSFTGYKNLAITPTAPHGKTLIAIGSIHVNGNGSSNCQLIGFYIDGADIHVQMKNTSTTSYTWTIDATGVYM